MALTHSRRSPHLLALALALALALGLALIPPAGAQEGQPIGFDLREWSQEGIEDWGTWDVSDDGTTVIQTLNHSPTFFVSPETFASAEIEGIVEVQTRSDDDYIGFVFGYQGPFAPDAIGYDFLVFNWKEGEQTFRGCNGPEGMSLLRIRGEEDPDADYTPSGVAHPALWCHDQDELDDRGYDMDLEVLDTHWGDGTGWVHETEHHFRLVYTPDRVEVWIDGVRIFDVAGEFPEGHFGFYNYSQANVRYTGFTQAEAPPEPGEPGVSRIDGGRTTGGDVRSTAIDVCRIVRPEDGSAAQVLLSRDDAFADALAGSALAHSDTCVLFTAGGPEAALDPAVRAEIDRVLADNGQLSLLGGTQAVSQLVEDELRTAGHTLQRFSGPTRYETAVDIARVAHARNVGGLAPGADPFVEVLLAFGENWPDAVTSGAYAAASGVPIVLTPTDALHPESAAFLDEVQPDRTSVIGGTGVISEQAAQAAPNPSRVSGPNRMATATAVAEALWPGVPASGEDFVFVNLEHPQAWTLALAAAPLSAWLSAPQLGVGADHYPDESSVYLRERGFTDLPAAVLVGDLSFISDGVAQQIATDIEPAEG